MSDIPKISLTRPRARNFYSSSTAWQRFAFSDWLSPPELIPFREYKTLTFEQKRDYNDQRAAYINHPPPIRTKAVQEGVEEVLELVRCNGYISDQLRMNVALRGPGGTGKTTLASLAARSVERSVYKLHNLPLCPDVDGNRQTVESTLPDGTQVVGSIFPVVWISLDGATTPRRLCEKIVMFFDPRYREALTEGKKGMSEKKLIEAVEDLVTKYQTQILVVDEIHFLNIKTTMGTNTISHMKALMNALGVTVVLTGIDIDPFINEGTRRSDEASQISGRLKVIDLAPLNYYDETERVEWSKLLQPLEHDLLLLKQPAGSLATDHAEYLYQRTGGYIQSQVNLLRLSAIRAIESGAEHISTSLMETVKIDERAEEIAVAYNVGPTARQKASKARRRTKAQKASNEAKRGRATKGRPN